MRSAFYVLLFLIGCVSFALTLIYAVRLFSKKNIKTRLKLASVLSFIGLTFLLFRQSDLITLSKIFIYSIPIAFVITIFLWKNRELWHKKIYKFIAQLIFVISLFFWQWLHTVSFFGEGILVLVVGFIFLFIVFTSDEKEFKKDFGEAGCV